MVKKVSKVSLIVKFHSLRERLKTIEKEKEKAEKFDDKKMFKLLSEHSMDYICVSKFDLKATVEYLNPVHETFLDYKIDDYIGKSAFSIIHPDDKVKLFPRLQKFIVEKAKDFVNIPMRKFVERIEYRLRGKDGKWLDVDGMAFNYKDKLFIIGRDITDRVLSEKKLKGSKMRFQLAAQISSDTIYEWDFDTDELVWYGNVHAALGFKTNTVKITKDKWLELIHPDDIELVEKELLSDKLAIKSRRLEYRILGNDGVYRYWLDQGRQILDGDNKPIKVIGACKDISTQKRVSLDLKEQVEKLERVNENLKSREFRIIELKEKVKMLERKLTNLTKL